MTTESRAYPKYHERAQTFGLCGRTASNGPQVCNLDISHTGPHRWQDNGWNLCNCHHAIVEHRVGGAGCCFCGCPEVNHENDGSPT